MSTELTLLIWSTTLFAGYILVQSTLYRLQYGIAFASSSRDNEAPPARVLQILHDRTEPRL